MRGSTFGADWGSSAVPIHIYFGIESETLRLGLRSKGSSRQEVALCA